MPIPLQEDLRAVAPWRAVRLSGQSSLFVTTDDPAISRIGSNPAAIEFSLPTGLTSNENLAVNVLVDFEPFAHRIHRRLVRLCGER